ncbi:MAG TPA: glycosyltransferase [Actinomycetota bacterium]
MSEVPERVRELLEQRDAARAVKDYVRADALRDQIDELGFVVQDAPGGATVDPKPAFELLDPGSIPDELGAPPTLDWSLHLLYEGFPDDLERFLRGFERHNDTRRAEVVVLDNGSQDAQRIETLAKPRPWVRCLHLNGELGWAAARNVGLRCSRGALVALTDLSIEPNGDILSPLAAALADPAVAVAGPFGLVSEDLMSWREADGPDAAAIEGYLLATGREKLAASGLVNERFTWYRNADIDLSFSLRAQGGRARVVPLPVVRHAHRGWEALDEEERARRSKRNHRVFLDRWRDRADLLA